MRSHLLLGAAMAAVFSCGAAGTDALQRADGLRVRVSAGDTQPKLIVTLPAHSEPAAEILFPEHVTVRRHGSENVEHLYLFRPGSTGERPDWRRIGNALEYQRDLPQAIHLRARATLEADGIAFLYEFTNRSDTAYDMIYAVTDPRLQPPFRDVRLERTYVHHPSGFELLASETPGPLSLPARYLASYTWPVPSRLIERRDDGITYYNKSRKVDAPFIATLSQDRQWVAASFTSETGNVWSNPELTCQHVDPQAALPPHTAVTLRVKLLIMRGSVADAFAKMQQERSP